MSCCLSLSRYFLVNTVRSLSLSVCYSCPRGVSSPYHGPDCISEPLLSIQTNLCYIKLVPHPPAVQSIPPFVLRMRSRKQLATHGSGKKSHGCVASSKLSLSLSLSAEKWWTKNRHEKRPLITINLSARQTWDYFYFYFNLTSCHVNVTCVYRPNSDSKVLPELQ